MSRMRIRLEHKSFESNIGKAISKAGYIKTGTAGKCSKLLRQDLYIEYSIYLLIIL